MRTRTITALTVILFIGLAASAASAGTMDGTVKMGGIIVNQTGDRSAVQEMFNVYNGYSLTEIRLNGLVSPHHFLSLDLQTLNLDSRKGDLVYRSPGLLKLTAGYVQHRQIFSPDGAVDSKRKDWRAGLEITPAKPVLLGGYLNVLTRDGGRLSYPAGTVSVLGTHYDNSLRTGEMRAEIREGRHGAAISYRKAWYTDELNREADRIGEVLSGRLWAPMPFYDKWTNLARGSFGVRRVSARNLEWRVADLQYTGVLEPVPAVQLRYNFEGQRLEDRSTGLTTDRFVNGADASYFYRYGQVRGGYAYETNDDDRTLTSYHGWNAGTDFHYRQYVTARVDYASRTKKDQEELTLLKDLETSRVRAELQLRPIPDLVVGGDYAKRERDFTDIGVTANGELSGGFGRYTRDRWGTVSADYHFSTDDYVDLVGAFRTHSHVVTGRAEFTRIPNLRLAGGVTFLDIGKDLDIEKSLVFAEGAYTVLRNYRLEVKYNVYNYDDYILLDRYFTANVLQINVAYDFHLR